MLSGGSRGPDFRRKRAKGRFKLHKYLRERLITSTAASSFTLLSRINFNSNLKQVLMALSKSLRRQAPPPARISRLVTAVVTPEAGIPPSQHHHASILAAIFAALNGDCSPLSMMPNLTVSRSIMAASGLGIVGRICGHSPQQLTPGELTAFWYIALSSIPFNLHRISSSQSKGKSIFSVFGIFTPEISKQCLQDSPFALTTAANATTALSAKSSTLAAPTVSMTFALPAQQRTLDERLQPLPLLMSWKSIQRAISKALRTIQCHPDLMILMGSSASMASGK